MKEQHDGQLFGSEDRTALDDDSVPNPLSAKPLAEAPAVVALLVFGDFGKGGRASSSSWL